MRTQHAHASNKLPAGHVYLKDAGDRREATEILEVKTGRVYDGAGNTIRNMVPCDDTIIGERGQDTGLPMSLLSDHAAAYYHQEVARQHGKPVMMKNNDGSGRLITMDLGINDVHTAATLPNYAAGYKIAEGAGDIASPTVLVPKASDVYYTWNVADDFNRKLANATGPGGAVAEVNPQVTPATYTTVEYALGGFITTEVMSNADAPLRPFQKQVQMIVDALLLEREIRVATSLQTSANFNANLVQTVAAGAQWDGGAASDPIALIHHAIEQSYMTSNLHIIWSELVEHDFVRNPAVQKYVGYKGDTDGIPTMEKFAATLKLPPIHTAKMKYVSGGALNYVWGNHVVLVQQPRECPPTDQQSVATNYTFRWNGGEAPDGTMTAGFLVRTYYDPKRGARGGTQVVVVHNDIEVQTSQLVGGLILNAHQ